jgi:hypothetical protein
MTDVYGVAGVSVDIPQPPVTFLLGTSFEGGQVDDWVDIWDAEIRSYPVNTSGNGFAMMRQYSAASTIPTSYTGTILADAWAHRSDLTVFYSTKLSPQAIIAGTHDSSITSFLNSIPAGRRLLWVNYHEPYDDIRDGRFTAAQFRQANSDMIDLLEASNADRDLIKFGVVLTGWDYRTRNPYDYFPTATEGNKVDFVGVDVYTTYRAPADPYIPDPRGGGTVYRDPAYTFGPSLAFAAEYGKPWACGEHSQHPDPLYPDGDGSDNTNDPGVPSRANRTADALEYIVSHPAETIGICFFESSNGAAGPWWVSAFHDYNDRTDRSDKDNATLAVVSEYLATMGIA